MRNLLVWKKLAVPSVIGNIAEPLITLVAFGYGLGSLVGQVGGTAVHPVPRFGQHRGERALAATFEALYSAFSRMAGAEDLGEHHERPDRARRHRLRRDAVGGDEVAVLRAPPSWSCSSCSTSAARPPCCWRCRCSCLVGITFASIALVFNALAKGYDFFTYYFTLVITPMTFLSGVYFPIAQMPAWLQAVAQVLPLNAAVDLVRPTRSRNVAGRPRSPVPDPRRLCRLRLLLALVLTRRRFFR